MKDVTQYKTYNGIKRARCAILTKINSLNAQLAELDIILREIGRYEPAIIHGLKNGDAPEDIAHDLDIDVSFVKMHMEQVKGQVRRSESAKVAHANRLAHRIRLAKPYFRTHPNASDLQFARYMGFSASVARKVMDALQTEEPVSAKFARFSGLTSLEVTKETHDAG